MGMLQEYVMLLKKLKNLYNCFSKGGKDSQNFSPSTPPFLFLIQKGSEGANDDWDGQINMIRRMIQDSTHQVEKIVVNKVKKPLQEMNAETQSSLEDLDQRVQNKLKVWREKVSEL